MARFTPKNGYHTIQDFQRSINDWLDMAQNKMDKIKGIPGGQDADIIYNILQRVDDEILEMADRGYPHLAQKDRYEKLHRRFIDKNSGLCD